MVWLSALFGALLSVSSVMRPRASYCVGHSLTRKDEVFGKDTHWL